MAQELAKLLEMGQKRHDAEEDHPKEENSDKGQHDKWKQEPAPKGWSADPDRKAVPTPRAALTSTTTVTTSMIVQVPAGCKPGATTIIVYPSGKQDTWTIPPGAVEGQEFTLSEESKTEMTVDGAHLGRVLR